MKHLRNILALTLICALLCGTTCSAATLGTGAGQETTGSATVTVDTTKTVSNGGSLPDGIMCTITIPVAIQLTTTDTSVTNASEFGNSAGVISISGSTAGYANCCTVKVESTNASDTADNITLANTGATLSSNGGKFYVGSTSGVTALQVSSNEDKTAVMAGTYSKPIVITGVKGLGAYGTYTGGLKFVVTDEAAF